MRALGATRSRLRIQTEAKDRFTREVEAMHAARPLGEWKHVRVRARVCVRVFVEAGNRA